MFNVDIKIIFPLFYTKLNLLILILRIYLKNYKNKLGKLGMKIMVRDSLKKYMNNNYNEHKYK